MAPSSDRPTEALADDRRPVDDIYSLAYEELRRLAATVKRGDASDTLNPTALVNEAWFKLARSPSLAALPRAEFLRVAARAMRQVLVEAARRRNANKRGGQVHFVTFDEALGTASTGADYLLELDAALQELAEAQPRQATMIECRFFAGMEVAETAALLGVSEVTIHRDWRVARAWLADRLSRFD